MCKLLQTLNIQKPKLYLAGKVVIVTGSEKDLKNFLNAASYPPYISPKDVEKVSKTVAVSVADRGNYVELSVIDLPTLDTALALANALASRLEHDMPHKIHGVEAKIVYRASEDGGLETRYTVSVHIHKKAAELVKKAEKILEEVAKTLRLAVTSV